MRLIFFAIGKQYQTCACGIEGEGLSCGVWICGEARDSVKTSLMRKRTRYSLLLMLALVVALVVAVWLRKTAPPEAARLLPESDAIVYVNLKPVRSVTHLDRDNVSRSPDYQHFVDATGIVPERDLDAAAFALHRMDDPNGPNGPVAYSEVFEGRFDGARLAAVGGHDQHTIVVGRGDHAISIAGDDGAGFGDPLQTRDSRGEAEAAARCGDRVGDFDQARGPLQTELRQAQPIHLHSPDTGKEPQGRRHRHFR